MSLVVGALAIAVRTGVAAAVFCASRPRSVATRTVETLGLLFYSMPAHECSRRRSPTPSS